ncbi:MAG: septum formation initiator family protein [Acidimicrobiales bacterium]|nr:septum formation initiator family protein [Acidimicrobiales bacterium]
MSRRRYAPRAQRVLDEPAPRSGRSEPPPVSRSRGRRVGRVLGMVGGGACVAGVLAVGVFPTGSFLDQRSDTAESQSRLEVLREQNEALEQRIGALQTDAEIERLAREQYNLVLPGEEAYAVLPAPLPPLELPEIWPFGPLAPPTVDP